MWTDLESLSKREEFLGEITLIIMPASREEAEKKVNSKLLIEEIKSLKAQGLKNKEIAKKLSQKYKLSAKKLYKLIIETN